MPRKRHKSEEIVAKLREVDVLTSQGQPVADAVRSIGLKEVTYYRWRQEFGGLNAHPASSRGDGVVALARTDDADASLASVLAAAGRIVVELNEYPGGRRFMFADPWGNVLGVYQPLE